MIKTEKPDVIIAATGSKPIIPKIPGVDKDNVVAAQDVLSGAVNTGGRIVVV